MFRALRPAFSNRSEQDDLAVAFARAAHGCRDVRPAVEQAARDVAQGDVVGRPHVVDVHAQAAGSAREPYVVLQRADTEPQGASRVFGNGVDDRQ